MNAPEILAGFLMLAAAYLPGHFLGGMLLRKGDALAEGLLLRLAASVGLLTPVATALAVFGVFGVWSLAAAMLGVALLLFPFRRRGSRARPGAWDVAPIALVTAAFALYSIPAEYVVNTRDPGVYALVAERLAATGELFKRDALLDAVSAFQPFDGQKYPGFAVLEGRGGALVVPQFFPGPFALLAVGSLAFGTWGGLYVVPVLGALSVGVAFALGRELFGRWAGLCGAALFAVSYGQVWWARHPSSEVMAQLLILSGLWLAVRFTKNRDAPTGVIAGTLLGAAMLVRADAFLGALALPLLFARDLLTGDARRALRWLLPGVPLAVFAAAALAYLETFGSGYLGVLLARHDPGSLLRVALFAGGAVLAAALASLLIRRRLGRRTGDFPAAWGGRLWFGGALVVAAVALWGYFLAPVPWSELPAASRDFDAYRPQILLRLVWFTTPVVALLGLAGVLFASRRPSAGLFAVAGAFLSFGLLYTFAPNVAPDLPWATRRFVPAVFPVLCLLAGLAVAELARYAANITRSRWAGVLTGAALMAVALGWTVYLVLPILPFRELEGAVGQFSRINGEIPASEVVFVEAPRGYDPGASTFEYAYGRDVLPYDRLRFIRQSDRLREAGLLRDAVYVTTDGGPAPFVSGLEFAEVGRGRVDVPRIQPVETRIPMSKEYLEIEYRVFRVVDGR